MEKEPKQEDGNPEIFSQEIRDLALSDKTLKEIFEEQARDKGSEKVKKSDKKPFEIKYHQDEPTLMKKDVTKEPSFELDLSSLKEKADEAREEEKKKDGKIEELKQKVEDGIEKDKISSKRTQKEIEEDIALRATFEKWKPPKNFQEIEGGDYGNEEKVQLLRRRHKYLWDRIGMLNEPDDINMYVGREIKKEIKEIEEKIKELYPKIKK